MKYMAPWELFLPETWIFIAGLFIIYFVFVAPVMVFHEWVRQRRDRRRRNNVRKQRGLYDPVAHNDRLYDELLNEAEGQLSKAWNLSEEDLRFGSSRSSPESRLSYADAVDRVLARRSLNEERRQSLRRCLVKELAATNDAR